MPSSPSNICPYCGTSGLTGSSCSECGGLQDQESRDATAADVGPWFTRDTRRPFFPGCSLGRLTRMIQSGHITRTSVIRGPATNGFWMPADRVPGIAHLLGICHACGEAVHPKQVVCAACHAPLAINPEVSQRSVSAPAAQPAQRSSTSPVGSAVDLVSRAQYRRIERLQNTVRIQLIGLALSISLLGAVLILFLVPGLMKDEVDPLEFSRPNSGPSAMGSNPTTDSTLTSDSQANAVDSILEVESIPLRAEPQPASFQPSSPQSANQQPDALESGATTDAGTDAGKEALEKVLEVMRDVTPAQRALLQELRVQLDRAEDPVQPIGVRLEAVKIARSLIDEFPVEETDEFFRARLAALRGEFTTIEQQILSGSTSSS